MKPKTFCQLYVHLVFAVKNRNAVLNDRIRNRVFKFMSGILTQNGHKSICVDGRPDHVHMLVGLNPSKSISELVQKVKRGSSFMINQENLCLGKFSWQSGYGAFSVSHRQLDRVYNYVLNQEQHHHKKTFREEYLLFLEQLEIEIDEKYHFCFMDDV